MSEPHQVTVHVGLASQLHEQARAIRELRAALEEQIETNTVQTKRIIRLQGHLHTALDMAEHAVACVDRQCLVCLGRMRIIQRIKEDQKPLGEIARRQGE